METLSGDARTCDGPNQAKAESQSPTLLLKGANGKDLIESLAYSLVSVTNESAKKRKRNRYKVLHIDRRF